MKFWKWVSLAGVGIGTLFGMTNNNQEQNSKPEIRQTVQKTSEETKKRLSELIKEILNIQEEFSRAKYQQNKIKELEQMAKHLTSAKAKAEEVSKKIDIRPDVELNELLDGGESHISQYNALKKNNNILLAQK